MAQMNTTSARWTTALAAAAAIALAAPGFAQTVPPAQPAAVNQNVAKEHLSAARNALHEAAQLPATAQLTGDPRLHVQQLIANFNELIAKDADWRGSYAKVQSSLASLLEPEQPAASGVAGAIGTAGTESAIAPAIRAKLTEFRTHLDRFEAVSGGGSPAPHRQQTPPPSTATMIVTDQKADSPTAPGPLGGDAQEISVVARDLLVHVEALEVILGAQTAAQKAATTAAGGAVVSYETVTGSTRTTVTGSDVSLNAAQLAQVKAHLKELRRLLERR